jgi:predicted nucleic acid-binding protein
MAVVVDSAPVILLSSLGQFHLLHERFAEILVAPASNERWWPKAKAAPANASCRTRS